MHPTEELEALLKRKKELEKLILQGGKDLFAEYNEVTMKIQKIQYPHQFYWK